MLDFNSCQTCTYMHIVAQTQTVVCYCHASYLTVEHNLNVHYINYIC